MSDDVRHDAAVAPAEALAITSDGQLVPAEATGVAAQSLSMRSVWRIGFALLGVVAVGAFALFVLRDGGDLIFTVLMSLFAAIAMAPGVDRLAKHMRRGAATGLVMGAFAVFVVLFLAAFGKLFVDQVVQLLLYVPKLVDGTLEWVNSSFSMSLTRDNVLSSVGLTPDKLAAAAEKAGMSALGFLGSTLGALFSVFTFGMFIFYLSAQMPQFERWVGSLFPARAQPVAQKVWTITAEKTGGYIASRLILAGINAATTAIVFIIIGMPYWLALALWTGIVAQFVPTIGTYISIILPVAVGLLTPTPWIGVIALVWAVLYQQVENLFIEPKISSKAVDVNPAVSFGAVLLGAALFGVAGAFLAVPVIAMLLSLADIYGKRYELLPSISNAIDHARPAGGSKRAQRKAAAAAAADGSAQAAHSSA
ncbi:putative PurR-regulated permease PerM [Humibacillus xanthopallidus]|uniref:Putative PurR-regulated permease PerM n=2 Tax=Humibacillus xanthopallidus TaxID=412689 RepID=A0A543HX09_9MICO|nr:putative PurR-regulated permease PerM [Humibacillus xanthopallidus]